MNSSEIYKANKITGELYSKMITRVMNDLVIYLKNTGKTWEQIAELESMIIKGYNNKTVKIYKNEIGIKIVGNGQTYNFPIYKTKAVM